MWAKADQIQIQWLYSQQWNKYWILKFRASLSQLWGEQQVHPAHLATFSTLGLSPPSVSYTFLFCLQLSSKLNCVEIGAQDLTCSEWNLPSHRDKKWSVQTINDQSQIFSVGGLPPLQKSHHLVCPPGSEGSLHQKQTEDAFTVLLTDLCSGHEKDHKSAETKFPFFLGTIPAIIKSYLCVTF